MSDNQKIVQSVYILKEKIEEARGVHTLRLFPAKQSGYFDFVPGQFVTVYLPQSSFGPRGKAYTLTSLPGEKELSFAVKKMGEFSEALCALRKGSRVRIAGPYGRFFPGRAVKSIVFLAGGIGITPFYTVIKSYIQAKDSRRDITLFYSNKTREDAAFFEELNGFGARLKGCRIIQVLTRDEREDPLVHEFRRIDMRMLKKYLGTVRNRHYFICGRTNFIDTLTKRIRKAGISSDRIITEAFF